MKTCLYSTGYERALWPAIRSTEFEHENENPDESFKFQKRKISDHHDVTRDPRGERED